MNPKRILLVTMSLDIGGAETHVVALAKALKNLGYDISVASCGGVYVAELTSFGVSHYNIPLDSKNPVRVVRALYLLRRIMKEKRFDVVHAHARIPAALSALICRMHGVPLVTTVHGIYTVNGLLRRLTNWGEKTLAVSEDIGDYLMKEYGLSKNNILVTINGIDVEEFRPAPPDEALMRELGIRKDSRRLLYLGRLNDDSGEYAFHLLDIAESLASAIPGLQIIITGDGPLFSKLKQKADWLNRLLGYPCAVLTGARTDIPRILALADAVMALSRAALEAMACEKPVVLAGNYGYMGLFTQEKLAACVENNFTARGFVKPSADVLRSDCIRALSLAGEEKAALLSFGRQMVANRYSIFRMASDAVSVYNLLPARRRSNKKYDFALFGYYGYNNSGDDALLLAIVENLRKHRKDVSLCVMTNRVKESSREFGVKSFHRFNLWGVYRALRSSHVLVFGGGNLIQDATSTKSLLYYISVLRLAQLLGVKTMLYSNGIGPVARPFNRKIASSVLNRVDVITLRESDSLAFLENAGIDRPKIYLTADETLTMAIPPADVVDRMLMENNIKKDSPFLCVSLRPWKGSPPGIAREVAAALDEIASSRSLLILLIPMQLPDDMEICRQVKEAMKSPCIILGRSYSPPALIGLISKSRAMIGMRLHSLIYATAAGIPVGGIVYDNKISAFLHSIRQDNFVKAENLNRERMISLSDRIFGRYEEARRDMIQSQERLRALALSNSAHALALLDQTNQQPAGGEER
jgi:polysaccharide pyruvyl transferase CsaB